MNKTDLLLQHIEDFRTHLLGSDLYNRYTEADRALYDDPQVVSLAAEKTEMESRLEEMLQANVEPEARDPLLRELADLQRQMMEVPSVKSYMEKRSAIKGILAILEEGILRRIRA